MQLREARIKVPMHMHPPVVTKDPTAVAMEVQATYRAICPNGDQHFIPKIFQCATDCFAGNFQDYQPIDAPYHDFEHTLQGTLCLARLLKGRHDAAAEPRLDQRMFELGMVAILLHDTGYLKRRDDNDGTGAKYTITHVDRGADFAAELLRTKNFTAGEIKAVQNMIQCTGFDTDLSRIPFGGELERIVGFALGTADLVGQMAADDYVEKLPILFEEFAEAAQYSKGETQSLALYTSAEDLMRKTPKFWKDFVQLKLTRDFGGVIRYLNHPFPDGPNEYVEAVESNMERLRDMFDN